jgi:hypothetical protein
MRGQLEGIYGSDLDNRCIIHHVLVMAYDSLSSLSLHHQVFPLHNIPTRTSPFQSTNKAPPDSSEIA